MRVKRWMDKYGIAGLFLLTSWIGVYAATITCELLWMQRSKIYATVAASLVFYAVIAALVLTLGIRFTLICKKPLLPLPMPIP